MENKDLGKTSTGMQPNLEALLCYLLGVITGIVFYIVEKDNKFVRFHAMQSIVTFGAIWVASFVLGFIPVLGWIVAGLLGLVSLVLWIVLMIKAFQGEKFKLPVAGDIAEQNA